MKQGAIGTAGTLASLVLENVNHLAAIAAGLLTAAWMARQLWLSFREKKRD